MPGERGRPERPRLPESTLLRRAAGLNDRTKLLIVGLLFVAIVVADFATGSDLTLRALYLLPVAAAAWMIGEGAGVSVSALSVAVSMYFDVAAGLTRHHPAFIYADMIVRAAVYLAAARVIALLRRTLERLDALADTDPLTGLQNRRGFRTLVQRELDRARRLGSATTMVQFDLDDFKPVNDSRGHAEGDAVLVAVGRVLRAGRVTDTAARLGGDEFAILFPHTDSAVARQAVERVRGQLAAAMREGGWPVTFSMGVATFAQPPRTIDAMLSVADALMYEVKRAGKDNVTYSQVAGESPGAAVASAPVGRALP